MSTKLYLEVSIVSKYGFFITRLVVRGYGVKDAELSFQEGLNVIAGASNTGKSYVFECIDFVFGSSGSPKPIRQSKGYSEVLLEIQTYSKSVLTLRRNLIDKKMYKYNCSIDFIRDSVPLEIKASHEKDDENTVSNLLLNICNAPYKNVVKNKKGHTESFTFRDFAHITMLNEKKIIWSESPINVDTSPYKRPRSKSAFKTIMTGIDDSEFEGNKQAELSKTKTEAKIELIDNLITETRMQINELEDKLQKIDMNDKDLQTRINEIKVLIIDKRDNLKELESSRKTLWSEQLTVKEDKTLLGELSKRFKLLRKNYESDLKRLDFIDEAEYFIAQLVDVKCPLCNSTLEEANISEDHDEEKFYLAIKAEKDKINVQLHDLESTIIDVDNKIHYKTEVIQKYQNKIDEVNKKIEFELKPILSQYLSEFNRLNELRDDYKKKDYSSERIAELFTTRKKLVDSLLDGKGKIEYTSEISSGILDKFCEIVEEVLKEWKFDDEIDIFFDKNNMDIVLNDNLKKSFGKGYCAILNSAFIISILLYCISVGLPHPKIVILDSPLTTYKGKDRDSNSIEDGIEDDMSKEIESSEEDEISDEVKQAFFNYLSKLNSGVQIIILDNVDPNKEIQSKIKYHHFSRNRNIGRYGFIPI